MLQARVLRRVLIRLGFWPGHGPNPAWRWEEWPPERLREAIAENMDALEGPHLLALMWISSAFLFLQAPQ